MHSKYFRFNRTNSTEIGPEPWNGGSEIFFHTYSTAQLNFTIYSSEEKTYKIHTEGVQINKESKSVEDAEGIFDEDDPRRYIFDLDWEIISADGFFYIEVDGEKAGLSWENLVIKDFYNNEATLVISKNDRYKIKEFLSTEDEEKFILLKRLERVMRFAPHSTRLQIHWNIMELLK